MPRPTPDPAPAPPPAENFDALVADILANPELLMRPDLTPDQILEIQKRLNPYAGIGGPPPAADRKRVAAVSYTNLREDYLRRFTATSLVGFLFQVLDEWDAPAERRRWTPPGAAAPEPFAAAALVGRLEASLAVALEARAAAEAADEARRNATGLDAGLPAAPNSGERREVEAAYATAEMAAARAAGLLYAATHAAHSDGAEAAARLRATAEAGMAYPEVRAILERRPLPPAAGAVEMPVPAARALVGDFLRSWLEFDPSVHVRAGHDAATIAASVARVRVGDAGATVAVDTKDPGHQTLEAVRAPAPPPAAEHRAAYELLAATPRTRAAIAALLRDDGLAEAARVALGAAEAFRHYLYPVGAESPARPAADHTPPQDTFHRWGYYTEVNYEELRTITEALYPERPDLDWALALWDVFEGTAESVDAAFRAHCQRWQEEVPSAIKALEFGSWSLLADFKENRSKIEFYNRNTEVLKRILDRHADDKRIGAELMRNRVRQTKARNIAADGPDAPGLARYRRDIAESGQELAGKGVERVISAEEMRRLEKAGGDLKAAAELEHLDQQIAAVARLEELAAERQLTAAEQAELARARKATEQARAMIEVPDDAIQVDVFSSNPATGEFGKGHFYTKAFAPDQALGGGGANEAKDDTPPSSHPAVARSASRQPAR
jgi:hypothetical protein